MPDLATALKLGFIVPSSNTAVEPICTLLLQSLCSQVPNTTIIPLFTRISVTNLSDPSQFSSAHLVAAARLLGDADCDAILWNGTSGMWTGGDLAADEELAREVEAATGVKAATTTLATVAALKFLGARKVGIAVPYTDVLAENCRHFFARSWEVGAVVKQDPVPGSNLEIARSSLSGIKALLLQAGEGADAVVAACTNWPATSLADEVEAEGGSVLVDSVAVTVWMGLRMIGFEGGMKGWGRLMEKITPL